MLDLALFCSAVMSDNLATRFYWSKWLTFSFATLLQLSSGLGYTFSIYSNDLKRHFKCVLLVSDVTVPTAHKDAGKTSIDPRRCLCTQLEPAADSSDWDSMQCGRLLSSFCWIVLRQHEGIRLVGRRLLMLPA
jgi:hypothetical protein